MKKTKTKTKSNKTVSSPAAYEPSKIEGKWQKKWAKSKLYRSKEVANKDKFYVLDMFPYPSGEGLHVGHPKGYIATDVISRFERMNGKNVLHPMGFDAFGLPAENYAIKTKTNPADSVKKNVECYKKQLEILGFDYDWSREVNTTDPKYYKWTQWIFVQLFKKGLAYESFEPINWCPSCKTGLANEDVEDGRCERCGTPVEKKPMRQWVLKITDYADRLLRDLDAKKRDAKIAAEKNISESEMPHVIDKKNPPQKGKITAPPRRTIHALVRDPKTGKFLGLKWHNHPWITFIVGGVEKGEDVIEAAKREVVEETGYTDIKFVQFLGGPVKAEYFAAHKDVNRVAITTGILFELVSDANKEVSDEEKKEHEPIWMHPKDMTEEIMTCAELPFWLERLPSAVMSRENGVPLFVQAKEPGTVREGVEFVERNAIAAIVKHWSKDLYIGLKWKKVDWQTIITGAAEGNQTAEEGAINEIIEETGYLNPKFVRHLGKVDSKFYHVPKGVNRYAHFDVMYFELENGKKREITQEEKANHEIVWLTKEQMTEFISPMAQKYMWTVLFLGKPWADDVDKQPLLDWPESIKEAQRNWIGRSEGALIKFSVEGQIVEVFTTRPDTLYGVTYLVLAPEHKLVSELLPKVENKKEVENYIRRVKNETEIERTDAKKDKTGVELKGVKAINPANKEAVPVWIADYVLADYGTGAVMAVPAHDDRDWDFAKKFALPIRQVIAEKSNETEKVLEKAFVEKGTLINSASFNGYDSISVMMDITKAVGGEWVTKYKLRDWVFSRQRYWGEPIPVIHCPKCGAVAVPEKDLPVTLPKVKYYEPTGTGESPLAAIPKWVNVKCPNCKGHAKRETNTMPQWAGSSWYYLRYEDPKNQKKLVDPKKEKYWSPVDLYVGGAEHATRHLIYARFWHKFLYDIGVVSHIEPFTKLQNVGLIMGEDGRKMSKRFGNVVNPDEIVKTYGADTMRIYEMFMGPFDQQIAWSTNSMVGARRFIERVWKLKEKIAAPSPEIEKVLAKTIKKVTEDIKNLRFNTAISALMILTNEMEKANSISKSQLEVLLKLLAPFMPHTAEELWSVYLKNKKSIHLSAWPEFNPTLIVENEVTIVVQVNGKVRASFKTAVDASETEVKEQALSLPDVKKWVGDNVPKKVIVVKGKLVSIVV